MINDRETPTTRKQRMIKIYTEEIMKNTTFLFSSNDIFACCLEIEGSLIRTLHPLSLSTLKL
jgi:hypothetical protein